MPTDDRRYQLIVKEVDGLLTPEEQAELDGLQQRADAIAAPLIQADIERLEAFMAARGYIWRNEKWEKI